MGERSYGSTFLLALYGPICAFALVCIYLEAFVLLPELRALMAEVRAERRSDGELYAAREEVIHQNAIILSQQSRILKRLAAYEGGEE